MPAHADGAAKVDPRRLRGSQGEAAAQALLERRGYQIVDVNVRFGSRRDGLPGEIDIVAWDGPTLCFVEVKTRRGSGVATPREAVTPAKQRQISRLALAYAVHHGLLEDDSEVPMRFDIVSVVLTSSRDANSAPDTNDLYVQRAELVQGAFLAPDDFTDGF